MHTICVPVVLDMCHTPPYLAQVLGAEATLTTHRMHLLLTTDQNAWLEGQASGLRNKSAIVRDLIDTARQGLTQGRNLGAYSVGAGAREVERVPAVQAVMPDQPAPQPHLQPAVQQGAVELALELEPEKKSKKGSKSKSKHTKGSPEFEQFWQSYQASPSKANGQSKAKAWEVWVDVIKIESPQRLIDAIGRAIADIERRTISGEFASPLPDCFRWLRDEHYIVWLESHSPAQASGITLLS